MKSASILLINWLSTLYSIKYLRIGSLYDVRIQCKLMVWEISDILNGKINISAFFQSERLNFLVTRVLFIVLLPQNSQYLRFNLQNVIYRTKDMIQIQSDACVFNFQHPLGKWWKIMENRTVNAARSGQNKRKAGWKMCKTHRTVMMHDLLYQN